MAMVIKPTETWFYRSQVVIDELLRWDGHYPGTTAQLASRLGFGVVQLRMVFFFIRKENVGGYSIAPIGAGRYHEGITLIQPEGNSQEHIALALEGTTAAAAEVAGRLARIMNTLRIAAGSLDEDSKEWSDLMETIVYMNDAAFGANEAANGDAIQV